MAELLTACSALALAACIFLAWQCAGHEQRTRNEAESLRRERAKLAAHELMLEAHRTAIKRIDGKVGHLQRGRTPVTIDVDTEMDYGDMPIDPELAATLELQRAPAAGPAQGK